MQTLRVIDSIDDTIDDLIVAHRRALEDCDAQIERISRLRAASEAFIAGVGRTPVATTAPTVVGPKPKTDTTLVQCDKCGVSLTPQGLKIHNGRKHRPSFNAQAARDAAAAAL